MIHSTKVRLIMLAVAAFSAYAFAIGAPDEEARSLVTIREAPEHVVIYTLHRGPYDGTGPTIGRLFALLGSKGLAPRGNLKFAYLNSPERWSKEHWLTEISIPVDREALKLAGTLGDFTDVKVVPASTLAVAVKPAGMADAGVIFKALMMWIEDRAYEPLEGPCELFPPYSSGKYEDMKTEIMLPVTKPTEARAR